MYLLSISAHINRRFCVFEAYQQRGLWVCKTMMSSMCNLHTNVDKMVRDSVKIQVMSDKTVVTYNENMSIFNLGQKFTINFKYYMFLKSLITTIFFLFIALECNLRESILKQCELYVHNSCILVCQIKLLTSQSTWLVLYSCVSFCFT